MFDRHDPRFADGVGLLRNIRLVRFRAHKTAPAGDTAFLRLETRMENFQIESFSRPLDRDARPQSPTLCMAGILSDDVVMEGLTPDAIADLRQHSAEAVRCVRPLAMPGSAPVFRVEASLAKGQRLESCCQSLPFLRVGHCRMSPIPPMPQQ